MIHGLVTFTCPHCKHSVTTSEFSSQNGSRRTQAARAMNDHAAAEHSRLLPMAPLDARVWHTH